MGYSSAVPPQNMEAERWVLGAILLNDKAFDEIVDIIQPSDFYSKNHQIIYSAVADMIAESKQIDVVTVTAELEASNEAVKVGGLAYLGTLANEVPSTSNVDAYAKIIRNMAIERDLLAASSGINEAVRGNGTTREKADRCEALVLGAVEEREVTGYAMPKQIMTAVIDSIEERHQAKGGITGLATGFDRIDKRTSGLRGGQLIVLAGRPSMGKTSLAMNIAENVAIHQKKTVMIFSLEMSKEELMERSLSSVGNVDNNLIRQGKMKDDDYTRNTHAIGLLRNAKMLIDDSGDISALQIRSRARRARREHGLDLIVVDYLQMMNISSNKNENKADAIGTVTRQLKITAKELNVPIILLSQLNRSLESRPNKRPIMSDLRDSGSIEQDADIIWFCYRDSQYNEDSPDGTLAEIITAKFRAGETGYDTLDFQGKYTKFINTNNYTASRSNNAPQKQKGGFN